VHDEEVWEDGLGFGHLCIVYCDHSVVNGLNFSECVSEWDDAVVCVNEECLNF
jgi:hypothetical protein